MTQQFQKVGGVEAVAEMLNLFRPGDGKGASWRRSRRRTPSSSSKIRRLMFVFEDILLLDDRGIQSVLKEIENNELSLALRPPARK